MRASHNDHGHAMQETLVKPHSKPWCSWFAGDGVAEVAAALQAVLQQMSGSSSSQRG